MIEVEKMSDTEPQPSTSAAADAEELWERYLEGDFTYDEYMRLAGGAIDFVESEVSWLCVMTALQWMSHADSRAERLVRNCSGE